MRIAKLNRIVAGLVLALGGCNKDASAPPDSDRELPIEGAVLSGSAPTGLEERVKGVAAEYQKWGRVDDALHWAPYLCRPPLPSFVRFSKTNDRETHGQKMYFVFAKDGPDYCPPKGPRESAKGQVVVKQSWHAKEGAPVPWPKDQPIPSRPPGTEVHESGNTFDCFQPYILKDGKWYRTGKQGPLFVMMKVGTDDPSIETDAGWVYATIEPDTREITGLGKIASCMKCHVDAPYDRLFGLPK